MISQARGAAGPLRVASCSTSMRARRLVGGLSLVPTTLPETSDLFMTPRAGSNHLVPGHYRCPSLVSALAFPEPASRLHAHRLPRRTGLFLGFTRLSEVRWFNLHE